MKNELISIIIPVYNAEKYIERCVESVQRQSYKNIEIIIVNDGSVDKSENICCKLAKQDKRIRLYSQKNMGVSAARNRGIKESKGKYIGFVDADDYIDVNMYDIMVDTMVQNSVELVVCGWKSVEENNIKAFPTINEKSKYNRDDAIYKILSRKNTYSGFLCNKLFCKNVIDKYSIKLDESISIVEDLLFCIEYIMKIENIFFISSPLYYYDQTTNGVTKNNKINSKFELEKQITELKARKLISEKIEVDEKKISSNQKLAKSFFYAGVCNWIFKLNIQKNKEYKKIIKKLKKSKNYRKEYKENKKEFTKYERFIIFISNSKILSIIVFDICNILYSIKHRMIRRKK